MFNLSSWNVSNHYRVYSSFFLLLSANLRVILFKVLDYEGHCFYHKVHHIMIWLCLLMFVNFIICLSNTQIYNLLAYVSSHLHNSLSQFRFGGMVGVKCWPWGFWLNPCHGPKYNTKYKNIKSMLGLSWVRLCTSTAGGVGLIPGRGTKIPHASQCGKKKKKRACYMLSENIIIQDQSRELWIHWVRAHCSSQIKNIEKCLPWTYLAIMVHP